jgi:uncharacterized protein YeaO (DUF488 family)
MTERHMTIALKRVYDEPAANDGTRVLVERLWPRGLSKGRAHIDLWLRDVAPSHELRNWFGHDPEKFAEFRRRYEAELADGEAHQAFVTLLELARQGPLTLVFAAHDMRYCSAVVLHHLLQNMLSKQEEQ